MKAWLAFVVGTFLVSFHWTMVASHVGPFTPITETIRPIERAYIYPIFRQNWMLFAPKPPVTSLSIVYQCQLSNRQWSNFREPAQEILNKHYTNRISYHGKILALVESMARNLINERIMFVEKAGCKSNSKKQEMNVDDKTFQNCAKKALNNQLKSKKYLLAERFVKDLCVSEFGNSFSEKIYVVSRNVTPFSKKDEHIPPDIKLMDITYEPHSQKTDDRSKSNQG